MAIPPEPFFPDQKWLDEEMRQIDQITSRAEAQKIMAMHRVGALGGGYTGGAAAAAAAAAAQSSAAPRWSLMDKLAMRLNAPQAHCGFDFIQAVKNPHSDNVVVFIIAKDGKPLTLEDDVGMFPSDRLVGQLNLLR